ncbi:MAG TPA: hypothetical protein VHR43_07440 [Gemmatimonadales bacterium]|jgi:hypothetical protein|nr:hypothetical protein [Gemmatimonadales bacterium]
MCTIRLGLLLTALTFGPASLAAQQPAPASPHPSPHGAPAMHDSSVMAYHRRMSDSLNARLDTLVSRMNKATGDRKVAAMADVINELVGQRRAMQAEMHRMMESPDGMRRMHGRPWSDSTRADSAAHRHSRPS